MVSLGLAVFVDPANFVPELTDQQALMRRRIFGAGSFLLMASFLGWLAFLDLTGQLPHMTGWLVFFSYPASDCLLILFAAPAISVWFQIASRARARRHPDGPRTSFD